MAAAVAAGRRTRHPAERATEEMAAVAQEASSTILTKSVGMVRMVWQIQVAAVVAPAETGREVRIPMAMAAMAAAAS